MEDSEFQALETKARELGTEDGHAAGTWIFDGNTTPATYVQWRKWLDDGDPEMWSHYRAPLSGEYADDMNPQRLMEALDAPSMGDEAEYRLCSAYEQAHADAWSAEIERVVRLQTTD